MSLLSDLIHQGYPEAPDFYVDLPELPRCPGCGSNAHVYVSDGTHLVCVDCRDKSCRGVDTSSPSTAGLGS
jgi:hypothetical protein